MWIEKLGRDASWAHTDGCNVVNGFDTPNHESGGMKVLLTCDTPEQAEEIFDAWIQEIVKEEPKNPNDPPAGSWAAVARMMAQNDNSGFDWDQWKDEMKERDM